MKRKHEKPFFGFGISPLPLPCLLVIYVCSMCDQLDSDKASLLKNQHIVMTLVNAGWVRSRMIFLLIDHVCCVVL